jgi:hypothetical protein
MRIPLAIAAKVNSKDNPLFDVRLSTPFGNGSSTVSGHSEPELFQVRPRCVQSDDRAVAFLDAPQPRFECCLAVVTCRVEGVWCVVSRPSTSRETVAASHPALALLCGR